MRDAFKYSDDEFVTLQFSDFNLSVTSTAWGEFPASRIQFSLCSTSTHLTHTHTHTHTHTRKFPSFLNIADSYFKFPIHPLGNFPSNQSKCSPFGRGGGGRLPQCSVDLPLAHHVNQVMNLLCFRVKYAQRLKWPWPIFYLTQAHCGNSNHFTSQEHIG